MDAMKGNEDTQTTREKRDKRPGISWIEEWLLYLTFRGRGWGWVGLELVEGGRVLVSASVGREGQEGGLGGLDMVVVKLL